MRYTKIVWVLLFLLLAVTACSSAEALFRQGNEHYQKGVDLLREADQLSQAGKSGEAMGKAGEAQAELEAAIASYENVLSREPENVSAMTNLGSVLYTTGQFEKAVEQYGRALELAPADADIHSNLAAAYVQLNQLEKALAEYQSAIDLKADLAEAHFGLGVVYLQLGQNDKARQAFEAFQASDKGTDPIASQQAKEYLEQLKGQ